ncbi:alpha-D-ribose 1-methylphosphonate 5-triphosphate diphosphatase [Mycobacterium sp. AT1]|uniref:alpha-D-ribose 1-methylphosphonate 5-triphosphate diphosphatase n=1 Tax=Mycobacterium sp. AT1 TaxID=1961706 RepID=UPI0009AC4E4C|nr:alpha-D-ribose 1-methylphosphonate 5-triphosphate diphosphatase [Mycobacterium sp. AT1]OPX05548.1 alpha-D-ribose 1-methylphosphonate 5-triphosphate diphosphatase [Mycobacterium sp. AT1]
MTEPVDPASPISDSGLRATVGRDGAYSTAMHQPVVTLNARRVLVAGRERSDCYVTIRNGVVDAVTRHRPQGSHVVELGSLDLIPGVIDLHCDSLNRRVQPRPGTRFPLGPTLLQADTEGVSNGVTTQCLCVTVDEDLVEWGDIDDPLEWLHVLQAYRPGLRTDTYLHVRFELSTPVAAPPGELLDSDYTRLVSYMVHAPGVGQYTHDRAAWHKLYLRSHPGSSDVKERLASERLARANDITDARRRVATAARTAGMALASHDDITPDDVLAAAQVGASIVEFPLTMEAAEQARSSGMGVIVGAPNAWQGRSHLAWLSARTAVRAGVVDALVSDYHPASMLEAAYGLARDKCASWADALNLVTQGPARLAGFTDRGQVTEGLSADLAAVDMATGTPIVRQTWRHGTPRLGLP